MNDSTDLAMAMRDRAGWTGTAQFFITANYW